MYYKVNKILFLTVVTKYGQFSSTDMSYIIKNIILRTIIATTIECGRLTRQDSLENVTTYTI